MFKTTEPGWLVQVPLAGKNVLSSVPLCITPSKAGPHQKSAIVCCFKRVSERETDWQADRQAGRHIDRQTTRQTDRGGRGEELDLHA